MRMEASSWSDARERPLARECGQSLKVGKARKWILPLKPPEETSPINILNLDF